MTQMLCMISNKGNREAKDVTELLRSNKGIREQAERCLRCWLDRIEGKVEPESIILLMGQDAFDLLHKTEFNHGDCKICPTGYMQETSLFCYLVKKRYKIIPIIHAAGINHPRNKKAWYKKSERELAHRSLLKQFGSDAIAEILPPFS